MGVNSGARGHCITQVRILVAIGVFFALLAVSGSVRAAPAVPTQDGSLHVDKSASNGSTTVHITGDTSLRLEWSGRLDDPALVTVNSTYDINVSELASGQDLDYAGFWCSQDEPIDNQCQNYSGSLTLSDWPPIFLLGSSSSASDYPEMTAARRNNNHTNDPNAARTPGYVLIPNMVTEIVGDVDPFGNGRVGTLGRCPRSGDDTNLTDCGIDLRFDRTAQAVGHNLHQRFLISGTFRIIMPDATVFPSDRPLAFVMNPLTAPGMPSDFINADPNLAWWTSGSFPVIQRAGAVPRASGGGSKSKIGAKHLSGVRMLRLVGLALAGALLAGGTLLVVRLNRPRLGLVVLLGLGIVGLAGIIIFVGQRSSPLREVRHLQFNICADPRLDHLGDNVEEDLYKKFDPYKPDCKLGSTPSEGVRLKTESVKAAILSYKPHLVTLSEVCIEQLPVLTKLLASSGWAMKAYSFNEGRQACGDVGKATLVHSDASELVDFRTNRMLCVESRWSKRGIQVLAWWSKGRLEVLACNVHIRKEEVPTIANLLNPEAEKGTAVVLGGDFNVKAEDEYDRLNPLQSEFADAGAARHDPTNKGGDRRIDYVFFSRRRFRDWDGYAVKSDYSDHRMVRASAVVIQ